MKNRYWVKFLAAVACTAVFCTAALAAETYKLKKDLAFRAEDVRTLQITQYSMNGEQALTIADKAVIAAVVDGLGNMEVRPSASRAEPKNGGSPLEYTITLQDNKIWRYRQSSDSLMKPDGTMQAYNVVRDYANGYMLFDDLISIPRLRARLGDAAAKIYQHSFSYNGNLKTSAAEIPADMRYEDDIYLPEAEGNVCTLTFGVVKPDGLTVTLYRETAEGKLGEGKQIPVDRDKIALPGERGKYYLALDAKFAGGTVKYMLEFKVSDLPAFFDSIEYGNGEDGVTVTRTDAGITLTQTGQNRKFVRFIEGLDLRPTGNAATGETLDQQNGALPVRNPFTMTFRHGREQAAYQFSAAGIVYTDGEGSRTYTTPHPERIEALYTPLTAETRDESDSLIDYSLRGFLSKEVARFGDVYEIAPSDVEKLTVFLEETNKYTAYDVTDLVGKKPSYPLCGLESVILAKPAAASDLYWPRRFFLSFELVMKDGTVYRTGEGLAVNGQPAEWVVVDRDSGEARDLIAGRAGVETTRQTGLPVIQSTDDDGNISYVPPRR